MSNTPFKKPTPQAIKKIREEKCCSLITAKNHFKPQVKKAFLDLILTELFEDKLTAEEAEAIRWAFE